MHCILDVQHVRALPDATKSCLSLARIMSLSRSGLQLTSYFGLGASALRLFSLRAD